jgi:hypothetical protein
VEISNETMMMMMMMRIDADDDVHGTIIDLTVPKFTRYIKSI